MNEDVIKYEISLRNNTYTQIVNNCFTFLIEAFIRALLIFCEELIKKDKSKFRELLCNLNMVNKSFQNLNKKFYLFSKEITGLEVITKIEELCKTNHELFENNFEKIITNLLNLSISLYQKNYEQFYKIFIEQVNIINEIFNNKNEKIDSLLLNVFNVDFYNLNQYGFGIKFIEDFIKNKLS